MNIAGFFSGFVPTPYYQQKDVETPKINSLHFLKKTSKRKMTAYTLKKTRRYSNRQFFWLEEKFHEPRALMQFCLLTYLQEFHL